MEKISYKLTVESPVCVAGDRSRELSPYTDYILSDDNRSVLYIDQRKLESILGEPDNRHLIDTYSEALLDIDNNRSRLQLKAFLNNHLPGKDLTKLRVRNFGMDPQNRLPITPVIRSASRPFIPGSTLKGAIRTAILYHWLQNTSEGQQELENTYNLVKECSEIMKELAPLRARRRRRERLDGREFAMFRDLEKQLRSKTNLMLDEQKLFGKTNSQDFAPDSQHIRISDTGFFEQERLGVYNAARVRLVPLNQQFSRKGRDSQIPQPREAINKGKEPVEFSVLLQTHGFRNPVFKKLKDNPADQLLSIIREFSQAAIGLELYFLEEAEDMQASQRTAMIQFYEGLYQRSKKGETFMRIGMGKTYFDNSLGLALFNYAEDKHPEGEKAFRSFLEMMLEVNPKKSFFPITRTISTEPVLPFGWVKVS